MRVIRTPEANRKFLGVDLTRLSPNLQSKSMLTALDLERDYVGIAKTDYPAGDYLVNPGNVPDYLRQEVALLIYEKAVRFMDDD